jgi:uncharacterized protein YkwD
LISLLAISTDSAYTVGMKTKLLLILLTLIIGGYVYYSFREETPVRSYVASVPAQELQVDADPAPVHASPSAKKVIKPKPTPIATAKLGTFDESVVTSINLYRKTNNLTTLEVSQKLNKTAQCRIDYLIDNNIWSHDNFQDCFLKNNVSYNFGENLAKEWQNSDQAFEAWKKSPTHNDILLKSQWRYVGVSTNRGYTVATFSTKL